jgi:dTDP-3,4-didehydro-2,6-dideoxy-alpha-D-glucose 3-reductase
LRLGCLGTGRIAELAILRPATLRSDVEIELWGRNEERLKQLSGRYHVATSARSLQSMLADESFDAVYVGLPNSLHFEAAVGALLGGKSALVEKPLCLGQTEALGLASLAARAGRIVQEALMVSHHPWQGWLRDRLATGRYGRIVALNTEVTFPASRDRLDRMPDTRQGGGAWYDIGPYWLQFLQALGLLAIRDFEILSVRRHRRAFDEQITVSAQLLDGVCARLQASLSGRYQARHVIRTETATLCVRDFLRPTIGDAQLAIDIVERPGSQGTQTFPGHNYYFHQLASFLDAVRGGSAGVSHQALARALDIAKIAQAVTEVA